MPDFISYPFKKHGLDVSRETLENFNLYAEVLLKWQKTINLVSDTTLEDMAERHFLDSVQLIKYIPNKNIRLADLGSGAGFPGLILAMLGVAEVHLIESDIRKATFLREAARVTGTKVIIHDDRVEDTVIVNLDVVTVRALAPLKDLLMLTYKLATPHHALTGLFMKGEKTEEEVLKAQKQWNFTLKAHQSITDPSGKILYISNLDRK